MRRRHVSAHQVARQAGVALGCFVFVQLVGARGARAESQRKVAGFELVGTLGYGVAVGNETFDPFGATVGLDFGYTFFFGLRIGTDASYAFGRRMKYTNWRGETITTDSSSFTWGGSVGYDLLLSSFRLRGAADGGLLAYYDEGSAAPGIYFGPKVALIWQYRAFELGLQIKYLVTLPEAVQVGLMSGARF